MWYRLTLKAVIKARLAMLCQSIRPVLFLSYHSRKTEDLQPFDTKDSLQRTRYRLMDRANLLFRVHVMLACTHD